MPDLLPSDVAVAPGDVALLAGDVTDAPDLLAGDEADPPEGPCECCGSDPCCVGTTLPHTIWVSLHLFCSGTEIVIEGTMVPGGEVGFPGDRWAKGGPAPSVFLLSLNCVTPSWDLLFIGCGLVGPGSTRLLSTPSDPTGLVCSPLFIRLDRPAVGSPDYDTPATYATVTEYSP